MTDEPAPAGKSPDPVVHLQAAALELIAAARALLDAAEHTVRHPGGAVDLVSLLGAVARPRQGPAGKGKGKGGDDEGEGGVERIPVS